MQRWFVILRFSEILLDFYWDFASSAEIFDARNTEIRIRMHLFRWRYSQMHLKSKMYLKIMHYEAHPRFMEFPAS